MNESTLHHSSQMNGVVDCVVGYSGGVAPNPNYQDVQDYTEALLVEYNPDKLSYEDILKEWSTMDYPFIQQKTQYRSAIFAVNGDQFEQANEFVTKLQAKHNEASDDDDKSKIYVDVEPITKFYRAEEYHQDFMAKQRSSKTLRMF